MDDQTKNPVGQTEQQPAQETAQVSSDGAEKEMETSQEQATSKQEVENIKSSQGGGTRLERRIEKLQEKLESAKTQEDKEKISRLIETLTKRLEAQREVPPELLESEPLIRPEDYGKELDPQELERRLAQREQAVVLKAIQAVESKKRYEQALQEHILDMEKVLAQEDVKSDPDLREFIESQYRLANFTINPFTGQEDFVPTLKPSEIYSKIKKVLEKRATQEGAKTLSELRQQSQESAVPPSFTSPKTSDVEEEALIQKAKSEGTDEAWAEVLKKRIFK